MKALPRSRIAALLIAWMSCAASATAAGSDLSKWTHVAGVELLVRPAKGIVELALPPEVFALSRTDLADLRLATQAGELVPHVLRVEQGEPGRSASYRPARTFNPVFLPGKQSTVTVDFGSRAKRTSVDVDTPGTNFRRRVTVEAGQDGESWQVLCQTAWLFRIAYEQGSYSKNEVVLPDNDFRYLRITVFNAPDDGEQVPIREVLAWNVQSTPPRTAEAEVRSVTVAENPKLKATEIDADLGHENLPLHDVEMSFEDATFLRRVEVLGRNRRTRTIVESVEDAPPRTREVEEPWDLLTGGTIHRLPGGEGQGPSTGLNLPTGGRCRHLLVRVYNGDDAPLKFTGLKVRRLQYYLAFQSQSAGPYRLYVGNPEARRPQYDLEHFAGRLRAEGVTEAALGPASPNPLFAAEVKAVPWSERYTWLLWGVLVAVLAVLGILVARQARRARPLG